MNASKIKKMTGLDAVDIEKLEQVEKMLPLIADLTGADLFIDCRNRENGMMFVAAQSEPSYMPSSYKTSVVGCEAKRDDEPAVYRVMETRAPVRDIKAVTQEEKTVRQDAVPILGENGGIIAVLIGERDISKDLKKERKYRAAQRRMTLGGENTGLASEAAAINARREVHHRVKNHLQLIASIMNIQARKSKNEEMKEAFRENIARILSIASINEILTEDSCVAELMPFLEKLKNHFLLLYGSESNIIITLSGDDVTVSSEQATDIAIVVNELVSNAFKHAFSGRESGEIRIILKNGERYASVTVCDNGIGCDNIKSSDSFGMTLVKMTVKDKLNGKVYLESGKEGTSITFDFLIDKNKAGEL